MDDLVAAAVEVLVDGLLPGAEVVWERGATGNEAHLIVDGERRAMAYTSDGAPPADVVRTVLGVFQDTAMEDARTPLPVCPGHTHAASLRVSETGAAWRCPDTGAVLREVGF